MSGFKFEGIHYTIQNTDISAEQGHLVIYVNNDQARIVNSDGQYRDLHIRTLYADNIPLMDNYTLNSTTFNLVSGLQNQLDNQNIETHKTVQTNPSFVLKPDGVGGLTWGTVSLSGAAVSHQFLNDLQGGQANQYFHLNYAQYQDYIGKTTVQQISGTLNSRIDSVVATSISGNLSTYTPLTTTASISGYLNSKIDSINLLPGTNVTIVESPANVWTISSTGGSGSISGDLSLYTLLSTTKEVSGALQASKANVLHDITAHTTNEINALYFLRPNGLGGVMWAPVSISGSQVDHNTLSNLQGGQFNQYYHLNQSQLQDFIGKSTVASISASLTLLSTTQSISGSLQNQIRTHSSDITRLAAVTGSYLTSAVVDGYTPLTTTSSISGNLQSQITNRATKVSTGQGTWNNVIVNSEGIVTSGGNLNYTLNSVTQSISANLQSQINTKANTSHAITSHTTTETNQVYVLKPDGLGGVTWGNVSLSGASVDHNTLSGLQGGSSSEYYHLTNAQYSDLIGKSAVSIISGGLTTLALTASISGNLQNQIRDNDSDITKLASVTGSYLTSSALSPYTLTSVTSSISGSLQNQIRAHSSDITRLASVTGSYATTGSLSNYTLLSVTQSISADLDTKINSKANTIHDIVTHSTIEVNPSLVLKPDGLGGVTWDIVGISGASVDHNTLAGLQGGDNFQYYHLSLPQYQGLISSTDVANISGSLQNQIRDNDADITRMTSVTGSYLTSDNLSSYTPLTVTSSISGSLQNQIRDNDRDITRIAAVTGSYLTASALTPYTLTTVTQAISANLQSQIDLKTDGAIGGGWDHSSLLTLSTNQTTNLTVGSPIKFDTVTGDHTLSNYRVRIVAGSTAMLRACVYWDSSSSSDFSFAWYNVSTGLMVGVAGDVLSINYAGNYGNNPIAVARVHVTNDTDFELRVVYNNPAITSIRASNSWASVESSIPKVAVGGGGWQFSSLAYMSAVQNSNISDGLPVKFDMVSGDHSLSNYRIKLKAGSKSVLTACLEVDFNNGSGGLHYQWYSYGTSSYIGTVGESLPTTYSTYNWGSNNIATAPITVASDTEVELRIRSVTQGSLVTPSQVAWIRNYSGAGTAISSWAKVESTDSGFTTYTGSANQIIYKETLATDLTTKEIQLPLTCKAIRVTLMLLNPQVTLSNVLLSVNGVSTGHAQWSYSSDGTSIVSAGEIAAPYINNIPANSYCSQVININSTGTDITFQETGGYRTSDNELVTENRFGYVDSTADITSITLTGSITNSIGAGSYIIVERLDADVAGGGSNVYVVNQTAHGLSSGNPVKVSAPGTYAKAQANTDVNARVVGVAKVINPDNFWIFGDGSKINLATTDWDSVASTSGGLSYSNIYYLDVNNAGKITSTQPLGTNISTSVLEAVDPNNAIIKLGSSNNLNNYTLLSTTASISGSLQSQINAISGSYLTGTLVTTLGNPGSDTNVPSEKAVRSALNALNLIVSGGYSGSGGGGWGSSSQLTMTQQTTGLTAGSPVQFTNISGDHSLGTYRVTLKAGTTSELSAELWTIYANASSWVSYQWYNVTAGAYFGPSATEAPITAVPNQSYISQAKARITVASDTLVELRVQAVGGTISSIEASSWGFVSSTLPQSQNTASDTYTSNSATVITTAASASLLDLTCGNVASGLYTVDGRWYQTNNAAGYVKLQASSDGGTNWTDLEALGTHYDAQSDHAIKGTYKHNQQLGTLMFRIYYATEGNSITFGINADLRFGRKLTAVGPINSPSFGGGWGKSGMLGLSANQVTGLTANSPVLFDTATGDFTVSAGSVVIKGGSKAELVFGTSVNTTSTSYIEVQWYNVTADAWVGSIALINPLSSNSTVSSLNVAVAVESPASDTTYQVRIKTAGGLSNFYKDYTFAKISATTPTGGAWAKSSVLTLGGTQSTGLTAGSPIQFANITGDHLLSNYGVTVKGGSVAMLSAAVRLAFSSTAGAWCTLRWYNVTTGQLEGPALSCIVDADTFYQTVNTVTKHRVSPVGDTVYQLRIDTIPTGTITGVFSDSTWMTVESTDPMWPSAGGWAKSAQLTMAADQSAGLAIGDAVRFNSAFGDYTLDGYGIIVKAGTRAKLTGHVYCADSSTSNVYLHKWYNVTAGAFEGTRSYQHMMTSTFTDGNNEVAIALVNPSVDSKYELRREGGQAATSYYAGGTWATVESTDPNPPKGGNWALSSLVTLSANQTTGLTVGSPIRFDAITGDHTLQNYRVKVKGGQKAELIGNILAFFSTSGGFLDTVWYNVTGSVEVSSVRGSVQSISSTSTYSCGTPSVAIVSPLVDTEYELRVKEVSGLTHVDYRYSSAQVHSTLPNASVTSQVIKKETVATNTTAWTVTLPVACKAVRITAYLVGAVNSTTVTLGVNGSTTGNKQAIFASNGASSQSQTATPDFVILSSSNFMTLNGTLTVGSETLFDGTTSERNSPTSQLTSKVTLRIPQSADISSITFTGSQTNGIGAGSYIIVERVDADLSQDLGWQDYTPTCYIDLTSATTVPNITPSVRYRVQGKTLFMQGTLNFTGAPTGATDLAISLPTGVNVVSLPAASKFPYAGHSAFTGGSGTWMGTVRLPGSTENSGRCAFRAQTSASGITAISTTAPFTWANGNQLEFDFFTEIQ
jgi:hypothetical protein